MTLIRSLLSRLSERNKRARISDSIYPIRLARGNYHSNTQGDTIELYDVTPIINSDGTITVYRDGYFIGFIIDYDSMGMV